MKKINITSNTQKIVQSAVDKMVDFIKVTYGPAGKKVILVIKGVVRAIDDAALIAKEFELPDAFENSIVSLVREASIRTNDIVGDGTCTALVLLQAMLREFYAAVANSKKVTPETMLQIMTAIKEAVAQIRKLAEKVESVDQLREVAFNSYNNDQAADIISKMLYEVGKDGVITIEKSGLAETSYEIVPGFRFDKGFISPYMITNPEKMQALLEDAYVFITDKKISTVQSELLPIMESVMTLNKRILIVCDGLEGEALPVLIANRLRGAISPIAVHIPGFGDDKTHNLEDIALLTGAHFFNDVSTLKIKDIKSEHLGKCKRVITDKDRTTIVKGGGDPVKIAERVEQLRAQVETAPGEYEKQRLLKRIANLTKGIAIVKIGAKTESELEAMRLKVEDAVNATQIAFKEGIVPGAGLTFMQITTSSSVLNKALKAPRKTLIANGKQLLDDNAKDPAGVLIAALESAASIAELLTSAEGIFDITEDQAELPDPRRMMR